MALGREDHEIHGRRKKSNLWIGGLLGGFVLLVFGVTVAKLSSGQMIEGFDHTLRPSITVAE